MNNFFHFRQSRDELIQVAPHLIPNPLPDVPVRPENHLEVLSSTNLTVGTVESGERASIFIEMSQRGVVYQLYTEEGEKMGAEVVGNCREIELETTPLVQKQDREWYEFYIMATHPSTGRSVRLDTMVWINAGQNDGVDPRPKSLKIRWNTPFELLIPDAQPHLTWKLRHGNGDPASPEVQSPEEGGDVNLVSVPLLENEPLVIRVTNDESGKEVDLTQVQRVKVFPNPNLVFENVSQPYYAAYGGPIQIAVHWPQSTVIYQLLEKVGVDEYLPSGDPVVGEGQRIVLSSGPLYDITTLRVLATKLRDDLHDPSLVVPDVDLFEYLVGEIEIDVEPDPTLVVEPEKQIIPYDSVAVVTLPDPQPETSYFLHCGDGVPVSDTVLSDGSPVRLTSIVLQEDCTFKVRATRRNISKDLYTHPQILVEPNYALDLELDGAWFRRMDGTKIRVFAAQASVRYELYKQPAQFEGEFAPPILCDMVAGQAGTLELGTGALPADRYHFFIVASKPERVGRLLETIDLDVSIRRDIAVLAGPLAIDYDGATWLEFPQRQPYVRYRIVNEKIHPRSEFLLPETVSDRLDTFPMKEDTRLFVQADHTLTDTDGLLDFEAEALVRPNPDIQVSVPQNAVEFDRDASLHFSDGQKSVTYRVTGHPRTDAHQMPPVITVEFSPQLDGPFSLDFGPVQWPMRLSVLAIKTRNRMEVTLPGTQEVNPYPKRNQEVRVRNHPAAYGTSGTVEVEGKDWNTRYQLLREDQSPEGMPQTISSPKLTLLTTTALEEDTRLFVHALGLISGLQAMLNDSVHIHVPPNLNLVPELVNLPFEVDKGAYIRIPDTQESAEYHLHFKGFREDGEEQQVEFSYYKQGGGDLVLRTGDLNCLRYEVRVHVKKTHSGMDGFLPATISFFAGVMERNRVEIDQNILQYGESTTLTIIDPQPLARYQLFGDDNRVLSEPVITGENPGDISLDTFPLYEDQTIRVRVWNQISDANGTLWEKKNVLLYPNPNLNPILEIAETVYDGYGLLRIFNAQVSVRYELIRQSVDEPGVPSNLQTGVVIERKSPQQDGEMNYAIGPLKFDQSFTLSAVKIASGLRIDFPEVFSVFVGPYPFVDVRYDHRRIDQGDILPIFLYDSQKGVKYQLRDKSAADGQGYVAEVVFNHFNVPVGQAIVGRDLAVRNLGQDYLLMRTPPVEDEITYEIEATKLRSGLKRILNERVVIRIGWRRGDR